MAEAIEALVTYTKDGHKKKQRKWHDGKLQIKLASREASLFSEDDTFITSGKIPTDIDISDDSDEFEISKHILVVITSVVVGEGLAQQQLSKPKENAIPSAATSLYSTKPLVVRRPPLAAPLPTTSAAQQRTSVMNRNNTAVSAFRPPGQAVQRSSADIMRLLSSSPPSSSTRAPSTAPQQQQPTIQPPPAKKPRLPDPPPPRLPIPAPAPPLSIPTNNQNKQWDQRPRGQLAMPISVQPQYQQQHHHSAMIPRHIMTMTSQTSASGCVYFPSAQEASKGLVRRVAVPDRFPTAAAYQQAWEKSLSEEITLKIQELAKSFHSVAASSNTAAQNINAIDAVMKKNRIPFYSDCELFIWKNLPGKNNNKFGGKRRNTKKNAEADDNNGDNDQDHITKPENVYLILKSGRVKYTDYSKGDIWVISNNPLMKSGFDPGQIGDRHNVPWVAVVSSLWFGPNQDGKFEVEFLSPRPPTLGKTTTVYALKGPNASMELSLMDLQRSGSLDNLPLLPALLGSASLAYRPHLETAPLPKLKENEEETLSNLTPMQHATAIIEKFKLNPEQASVVTHVASWGEEQSSSRAPPVCLVFGPFGCGKSSLLVAVLHLVLAIRKQHKDTNGVDVSASPLASARILVSAHTNVAVDRVLLALLESGCTDFLRVGALRRIHRRLFPHSLHAADSTGTATAAAELKDMLKQGDTSPSEEAELRAELAAVECGAERQRKKKLKTCPVVGVTCCAASLPVLENQHFDIVVLDECSQIIEPLAMAPILRAKSQFLIAAGDPKQLPPVIANPSSITPSGHGLFRPLFVRLSDVGAIPHLLRRQYRCHPAISAIPNAHFYGGKLLDGCTAESRPSLLPGMPSVIFVDGKGQEQRVNRSVVNQQEAEAVARIVERALAAGVAPGKCGVICFYKAQVAAVKALLVKNGGQLQAAVAAAANNNKRGEEEEDEEEEEEEEEAIKDSKSTGTVQVATVDAFQGAEKDIIILTTATTRGGSAFAADAARLNVALTRGKNNLVVVGHAMTLERTAPAFAALIKAARNTPGAYSVGGMLPAPRKE